MRLLLAIFLACWTASPCELLVKAVDWTNPDPVEDRVGCYKRGMPVSVKPDGWTWGKEEGLPRFWIIKVPGLDVVKARQFCAVWEESGTNYQRRLWKFNPPDIPAEIVTKLETTGTITISPTGDLTWNQARQILKNQKTGTSAPANP